MEYGVKKISNTTNGTNAHISHVQVCLYFKAKLTCLTFGFQPLEYALFEFFCNVIKVDLLISWECGASLDASGLCVCIEDKRQRLRCCGKFRAISK